MTMFSRKKKDTTFEVIAKELSGAPSVNETIEWKRSAEVVVGGLIAVGFFEDRESPNLDMLLAVGSRGQTIIDCQSGNVVYRNRNQDGYDHDTLTAWDLSGGNPDPVRMSGVGGGGLKRFTSDGWSVEAIPVKWPIFYYVLQHPGSSVFSDYKLGRKPKFDLLENDYQQMAWGFSNSGNSLLLTSSSDIIIWSRSF